MKTLGMLGGVGPETTAKVYLSVIERVRHSGTETYPPIVIYNLPFPFAVEREAIIEGRNADKMVPYLVEGAKRLERSGADFGVLPCNTLHKFIEDIRGSVAIPFLSIIEETVEALRARGIGSAGILGTATTVKEDLYGKALRQSGIKSIYPNAEEQSDVNALIVSLLQGAGGGQSSDILRSVSDSLVRRGAESVLLACTDLQLAATGLASDVPVVDTTEVLIEACAREILR